MTNPAFRVPDETARALREIAADLKVAAEVKAAHQNPHADLITAKLDPAAIWGRRNSLTAYAHGIRTKPIKGDDR